MKRQDQNGSATIIISIIIFVMILVALGIVVWNYFNPTKDIAPYSQDTSQGDNDSSKVEQLTVESDSRFPLKVSVNYPRTWTADSIASDPVNSSNIITLTSPTEKYSVVYKIGWNTGIGGTCEPGTNVIQSIDTAPVPKFDKALFGEIITGSESDGYTYLSSLLSSNSENTKSIRQGASSCGLGFAPIITISEFDEQNGAQVIWSAKIYNNTFRSFGDANSSNEPVKDIKTIQKSFNDGEYLEAKQILLSTTVL